MGVLRRSWLVGAAVSVCVAGCSSADMPPPISDSDGGGPEKGDVTAPPSCDMPATGCPCADAGAQASCGIIYRRIGSYISCSPGYYTCLPNGTWGECEGPSIYDGN